MVYYIICPTLCLLLTFPAHSLQYPNSNNPLTPPGPPIYWSYPFFAFPQPLHVLLTLFKQVAHHSNWSLVCTHNFLSSFLAKPGSNSLSIPAADHGWRNICDCTEWSYFKFMTTDSVSPWCCPAIILHFIHLHISLFLTTISRWHFSPQISNTFFPILTLSDDELAFHFMKKSGRIHRELPQTLAIPPPHLLVSVSIDSASPVAITKEPLGSPFPICALDSIPLHTYLL